MARMASPTVGSSRASRLIGPRFENPRNSLSRSPKSRQPQVSAASSNARLTDVTATRRSGWDSIEGGNPAWRKITPASTP